MNIVYIVKCSKLDDLTSKWKVKDQKRNTAKTNQKMEMFRPERTSHPEAHSGPNPHALSKRENLTSYPKTFQIAKVYGPNVNFLDIKSVIWIWIWIFHKFHKNVL